MKSIRIIKLGLLSTILVVVLCVAPTSADLPPGTDVSIGIEGAGLNVSYITIMGKKIVNSISVMDLPRATFGHYETSGALGMVSFLPSSLSTLTYKLELAYINGSFAINSLGIGTAYYEGYWYFYEPANGVSYPNYYEKAYVNVRFSYNLNYTSAPVDGYWILENGPSANPLYDWSQANPYLMINGTWDIYSNIGNEYTNPYYGQPRMNMHIHGVVIPEPATIVTLAAGIAGTTLMALKRTTKK